MLIAEANIALALASSDGRGCLYAPKHTNKTILLGRIFRSLYLPATNALVNCHVRVLWVTSVHQMNGSKNSESQH